MDRAKFLVFINGEIGKAKETVASGVGKRSKMATGKLSVYEPLQLLLSDKKNRPDEGLPHALGVSDAINDSLQALGLLDAEATFLPKD